MLPPRSIHTVLCAVGRTPLVELERLRPAGGARVFAKLEYAGPGNSIFDRAAAADVVAGERAGHLAERGAMVTAGGGDASISLAMAASASGHPLTVVIPKSLHPERRRVLMDYGAELEPVDDALGFEGAHERAFALASEKRAIYVNLFEGRTVVDAYRSIGEELVEALGAAPTLTVCGLDLGAIPTGIAQGLDGGAVLAVEPEAARIASAGTFGPHLQLGLAPAAQPLSLDRELVRDFEGVSDREAWDMAERLARETGLLAGLASGAVLVAALRRAAKLGPEATVVAVLPDSGERRFMLAGFFA